jgi:uncharacterized membrane protein YccC
VSDVSAVPPSKLSYWRQYWHKVLQFDHGKIEPWIALRNTLGVTLPLAVGAATGMPLGGLAVATGALQVSYSDGHNPYAQRAKRMLAATFLCALAVFAGGMAGRNLVLAVLLPTLWAFAAGLAVSLSPSAENLGVISVVTLIIFAAQPLSPSRALASGLLALGGGFLQTSFALLLWPVRRYQPEQRALADLYSELSRVAIVPARSGNDPPAAEQSTAASETLSGLSSDNSLEAARYWSLLNQAERIRLSLLTLRRLRKRMERSPEASGTFPLVQQFLELGSNLLASLSQSIAAGEITKGAAQSDKAVLHELETIANILRADENNSGPAFLEVITRDARHQMDAAIGQLRSAVRSATEASPAGLEALASRDALQPWQRRMTSSLATLRANLSLQSSAFRHAIRISICLAVGELVAHQIRTGRSYWLAMTIVLVLKQEFAATFSRGILRIGGTILGLVLATGLFHFFQPTIAMKIVLIGIFTFLLRWLGGANYGVFTIAVSALIVTMVAFTGVAPKAAIMARGEMTCIGGIIALIAYLVWPTWERFQVGNVMADMVDAYRDYFHAVVESNLHSNSDSDARLNRTRLNARLARSNMEASADRLRAEPGTAPEKTFLLTAMLANSHRFVRAVMALEAVPAGPDPVRQEFIDFGRDVQRVMEQISASLRGRKACLRNLPDLREDHHRLLNTGNSATARYALVNEETDRITNSLNTLVEQALKFERLP